MKTIKLNWGAGIAIAYSGFVAMILVLVIMSTGEKIDLVTNQYYAQELTFQDKINKTERAKALTNPLKWEITDGEINIRYPEADESETLSGTINLYCPANDKNDRTFNINSTEGSQAISTTQIPDGRYKLQIDWKRGAVTYWDEGIILIQHTK
jgi:nitrogen fixation protein FixH